MHYLNMKIVLLTAVLFLDQSQGMPKIPTLSLDGLVNCEKLITGTDVNGVCQHILNREEVAEGGRLFVDCSARSLFIRNSDVTSLHLYHWARQESEPRLLATYSIKSPEQNYTIAVDPMKYWKIARSQRWDRRPGSKNEMINRLQLAIYNFTMADVGEYICHSKRTQERECRCFGTVRMKGIMSMVDREVLSERESFTVTCSMNTMNLAPSSKTFVDFQSNFRYGHFYLNRIPFGENKGKPLLSVRPDYKFKAKEHPLISERSWRAWHADNIHSPHDYVLKLEVINTICSDTGLYLCCADYYYYFNTDGFDGDVFICARTEVVIKAPLDEFIFDVFTREGRVEYIEGATINMICSIQGPKDITFDWRFGRQHRNGKMIDYSYPLHNHATTTASIISKPGFDKCPYYQHKSHLSFRAERRYNGYKFYCVVYCHGKVARHGNTTLFVKTTIEKDNEVPEL